MLRQHGKHTLDGPKHCAVDDHGHSSHAGRVHVLAAEPPRHLEVELDRRALQSNPTRVAHFHVDLGAVEGPSALVHRPGTLASDFVESAPQRAFGLVPQFVITIKGLGWPRGELELSVQPELMVDGALQKQDLVHLGGDLSLLTKMCASSWQNRTTRLSPESEPEHSLR